MKLTGYFMKYFCYRKSYKVFGTQRNMVCVGLVEKLRDMGFDVFDDQLISYDKDTDPNTRMDKVVAEAHRFSNRYSCDLDVNPLAKTRKQCTTSRLYK